MKSFALTAYSHDKQCSESQLAIDSGLGGLGSVLFPGAGQH